MQHQVLAAALAKDARSRLQEWSQAEFSLTPTYHVLTVDGPDHERQYLVEVRLNDKRIANGTGKSILLASQQAAINALTRIELDGFDV